MNTGCPFGDDFPGWRILIEAFYTPDPGRTYGQGLYGEGVYGDLTSTGAVWVDITRPTFSLDVTIGSADPAPVVAVNEYTLELVDDEADWWDFAAPGRYNMPAVGAPIRFGLIDPADAYHAVGAGHVEAIEDAHDALPRYVTVTAYGRLSWLVSSRFGWARPAETADVRINSLLDAAGVARDYTIDSTYAPPLNADATPRQIVIRDELDRTAVSAGWYLHESPNGVFRFNPWPHRPAFPGVKVSDCPVDSSELLAHVITYRADTGALLNVAQVSNDAQTPITYESIDEVSVGKYGRRTDGAGFPLTGLAFVDLLQGAAIADRARTRYQDVVNRVESFDADTKVDGDWLAIFAALDVGWYVQVIRREVSPYFLETVITGYQLHFEPNRATATVYVSTLTPTL